MSQPHFGISVKMKLTLPKVGSWSPPGLLKFQSSSLRVKTPCIGIFFISMERSWSVDAQNGFAWAIWTFASKLWAKEGPGIKLQIWLPTTKSQESTSSRRCLNKYNTSLKSSRRELQLWFRPRPNPNLGRGVMNVQSLGTPTWDSFKTPTWESREKEPFRCSFRGETQRILYGGRWWLPLSSGRGESCVWKCLWLVLTPKGVPEC